MKYLTSLALLSLFLLSGCSSSRKTTVQSQRQDAPRLVNENTFLLTEVSDDPTYGYTEKNPVRVGGVRDSSGPANERRFLNALAGPGGEAIRYQRLGSCCMFETDNGFMGSGLLDMYEITWPGQTEPVVLYLNMYDPGPLLAPVGFTIKPAS